MKNILIVAATLFSAYINAQVIPVLITYDNIETYTWPGIWANSANSGYFTNASVSPNASAVLYGMGTGSSPIEQNQYILPNVTGLDASKSHLFKFRLGAYRFSSLNSTRGVDVGDYIEVRISTDGGTSYSREIRITGFNNSFWDYNTNATISKTANGTNTIYSPVIGGNRTLTGDGYSVIELTVPAGITQLAVNIYGRVNAAGEEWWFDDMELFVLEPDVILPIELLSFSGDVISKGVQLDWNTGHEINNSHFIIERSSNGIQWDSILYVPAKNEVQGSKYSAIDKKPFVGINYYRLKQYDLDKSESILNIISIEYKLNQIEAYAYQQDGIVYIKNCNSFNKFKLIDISGKVITSGLLSQTTSFETSEIVSGLYYLNLIDSDQLSSIIKVRILN